MQRLPATAPPEARTNDKQAMRGNGATSDLAPSAYHDPREVVWKHIVAQAYWDILNLLPAESGAAGALESVRLSFLKHFNGQYDIDLLCRHAEAAATEAVALLGAAGQADIAEAVAGRAAETRAELKAALDGLPPLRQVDRTPSFVADGVISIAGRPAEEFAAQPDFVRACLQLIGEDSPEVAALARGAWQRGFALDRDSVARIRQAVAGGWHADDLLADLLLHEQRSGRYPSLRQYEYLPGRPAEENRKGKRRAIEEGWFLLGRLMSAVALLNAGSAVADESAPPEPHDGCPLAATLARAGIALAPAQWVAFRQFALLHATHGLNPGELTARIASSVRTSFPRALLAGLMVRAGKVHAGALVECMRQMDAYLKASDRNACTRELLRGGELYGFGHRIHKPHPAAIGGLPGGDPRVAFQIARAREAFPQRAATIDALESFAAAVQSLKPSLRPNTDFGATVWFLCLGLAPEAGAALFSMNRLPGLIAQVINQLDVKANALRPPLAVNLPYPL